VITSFAHLGKCDDESSLIDIDESKLSENEMEVMELAISKIH